ncbi:MAG: PEP-CTERM sorting domain-containing protein [Phycisphaeraceae bacterium]
MSYISRSTSLIAVVAAATLGFSAPDAEANLLTNAGFEDAGLTGGDTFGANGWTAFGGGTFTVHTSVLGAVGANSGDHAFKMFGSASGVFQEVAVNPGDTVNANVVMLNFSGDQMANGQVAAINIEWKQGDGSASAITPFISNGTFTAADAPVDQWTLQTITGVAPSDAATARLTLITGDFLPGGPGGAPFYDDAFLEVIAVPEPSSLALLGLGGLALMRRRRQA